LIALLFLAFGCNSIAENSLSSNLLKSLDTKINNTYLKGESILLFAYDDKIINTEAYADWSSYLNEFKQEPNSKFQFFRIAPQSLKNSLPALQGVSEYSVFLKKGQSAFLYEGLIVEPQVYTAVDRAYNQVPLSDEDKAFLPTKIDLN